MSILQHSPLYIIVTHVLQQGKKSATAPMMVRSSATTVLDPVPSAEEKQRIIADLKRCQQDPINPLTAEQVKSKIEHLQLLWTDAELSDAQLLEKYTAESECLVPVNVIAFGCFRALGRTLQQSSMHVLKESIEQFGAYDPSHRMLIKVSINLSLCY